MSRSNSILIVEDDVDMAEIYRDTFQSLNYAVTVARSGREALDVLQARPPSVAVMDLTLPDMGFAQVLTAVRTLTHSQQTKLILVSGREDLVEIAKDYGAFAYLQKPFDVNELVKLLET
jgi:two-component system response regulator (stage 0 sporulation protein F)